MSEINYQALRLAAENATPGEWCADDYHGVIADAGLNANYYIASCSGPDNRSNKRFIAAANPATVLALLDENESMCRDLIARNGEIEGLRKLVAELEETKSKLNEQREYYEGVISDGSKRIAELEKSEEQLISERDHAESALADMYFAATGDRPEWSNWFGFSDAVDAVVDRIADLEAKQCIEEMSKQSCEARERDLFESWVMHSICISKSTLEGLRTETGYRNATLSGTDFNRMWEQWKSIRAAGIRIKGE
ncbi:ead/Ea22-like family protein [Escherichia coli]